jgi:hypothetical protein
MTGWRPFLVRGAAARFGKLPGNPGCRVHQKSMKNMPTAYSVPVLIGELPCCLFIDQKAAPKSMHSITRHRAVGAVHNAQQTGS